MNAKAQNPHASPEMQIGNDLSIVAKDGILYLISQGRSQRLHTLGNDELQFLLKYISDFRAQRRLFFMTEAHDAEWQQEVRQIRLREIEKEITVLREEAERIEKLP